MFLACSRRVVNSTQFSYELLILSYEHRSIHQPFTITWSGKLVSPHLRLLPSQGMTVQEFPIREYPPKDPLFVRGKSHHSSSTQDLTLCHPTNSLYFRRISRLGIFHPYVVACLALRDCRALLLCGIGISATYHYTQISLCAERCGCQIYLCLNVYV